MCPEGGNPESNGALHNKNGVAPKKKKEIKLSFLRKAQIVMGFDMDIETGDFAAINHEGAFRLGRHISGAGPAQVKKFLAEEGVTLLDGKGIRISAEDYYKLEAKYDIPVKREDIEQLHRRLSVPGHTVSMMNHNSAFGMNYARALKLLRDHNIGGMCQMLDTKQSMGDQADNPTITLSDTAYEKFTTELPEIIRLEAERKKVYDSQVQARIERS